MCVDVPESTTNSPPSVLRVDGTHKHQFSERWVRMLFCIPASFVGVFCGQLPRCFTDSSLLPLSLPEIGPQMLERWCYADEVHLGKSFQAMDFGLEWCLHIGLVSVCLSSSENDEHFGGSSSWNTQPNCRAFDEEASKTSRPVLSCCSILFNKATALLSPFYLNLLLRCSSTWRCA